MKYLTLKCEDDPQEFSGGRVHHPVFFLYPTYSNPTEVWRRILRDQRLPSFLISSIKHGQFVKSVLFYASYLGLMHSYFHRTLYIWYSHLFHSASVTILTSSFWISIKKWFKSTKCHPQFYWKILSTCNSHFLCVTYLCIKFDFHSYFCS